MRLFGSERVIGMVDRLGMGDQPIEAGLLSGASKGHRNSLNPRTSSAEKMF